LKDANEMLRLCWITSDWTASFVTDELEDTLIAEHVAETTTHTLYTSKFI